MSELPSPREPIADLGRGGIIVAAWYRLLAKFERLIGDAANSAGTGLTTTAAGALTIAANGVANTMLRDSAACSVIGRSANSVGDPADISALGDSLFLQRNRDDQVVFRYPQLPAFNVAGVPSAATQGSGTLIYVYDEVGGATIAFSDGTNWLRAQDRAVIS